MDFKLFENYKVASKLPYDIFKTICQKAAEPIVSDFNAANNDQE